ncbi:Lysophospholipase 1 [Exophiala oligosperma]
MRHSDILPLLAISALPIIAQNLSESYAPVYVNCPHNTTFTRPASEGLNPDEQTWVHNRKRVVAGALSKYLSNANMSDFDIDHYISNLNHSSHYEAVPTIGLAISGGGYASAIMGAGVIRALDGREKTSSAAGTGGLLQALTFLSGQSGGSWVVSSYTAAEFPMSDDLLDYWQPQIDRFTATTNGTHAATIESIVLDIATKAEAGFNVSVADLLGRINGYEFIPGPRGGLNVTLSNIKDLEKFRNYEMPLPIIQIAAVTNKDPNQLGLLVPTNRTPIYEMTPYEFGSWVEPADSFANMEYLGTTMMNGKPANSSVCVKGFDRLNWVIGASADAYEYWWLENHSNNTLGQFPKRSEVKRTPEGTYTLRKRLEPVFPAEEVEGLAEPFEKYFGLDLNGYTYARVPNPFRGRSNDPSDDQLKLVDATEVATSLPLAGQLARNASFIIAWDDNTDAYPNGWENGTNMYQAYRYFEEHNIPFPIVPTAATFIARNYTTKPVFFGCDAHLTSTNDTRAPIIAWFPNAPYSSYSNITFFQNQTPIPRAHDIWNNTFNEITQAAGALDPEWSACLACAAIDRSLAKVYPPMQRTAQCQRCFDRYCWDGVSAPDYPGHVDVDLKLVLNPNLSYAEWNATIGKALQRDP